MAVNTSSRCRPSTTWVLLDVALSHFLDHIHAKSDRCSLSIIDLLHVSNFKGGNASITETAAGLSEKLPVYEAAIRGIVESFGGKKLAELNDEKAWELQNRCKAFLALTKDPVHRIRGFGPSYASALLAAHFPGLIPILDRRGLNGAGILVRKDRQGQVKNIESYYPALIDAFRLELQRHPGTEMRQLDKAWFIKPLK